MTFLTSARNNPITAQVTGISPSTGPDDGGTTVRISMTRVRQGRGSSIAEALRTTGGAVGLCSLTTIIGYGSLLFAQNRALFSFGVVAVLGEIACLTTAIVVLPAVLLRKGEPRTVAGSLPDPRI